MSSSSIFNPRWSAVPAPPDLDAGRGKFPNTTGKWLAAEFKFIACPCPSNCRCRRLGCDGHWLYNRPGGPDVWDMHGVLAKYRALRGPTDKAGHLVWKHHDKLAEAIDPTIGATVLCDLPDVVEERAHANRVALGLLSPPMLATKHGALRSPDGFGFMKDSTLVLENLRRSYPQLALPRVLAEWTESHNWELDQCIVADLVKLVEMGAPKTLKTGEVIVIDSIAALRRACPIATSATGTTTATLSRLVDLIFRWPPVGSRA